MRGFSRAVSHRAGPGGEGTAGRLRPAKEGGQKEVTRNRLLGARAGMLEPTGPRSVMERSFPLDPEADPRLVQDPTLDGARLRCREMDRAAPH